MNSSYSIVDPRSPSDKGNLCALALMSKAPGPGTTKTRLVPPLAPDEAAALSACFVRDAASNIADISSDGLAEGVVVYTPVGAETAYEGLLPKTFSLLAQRGEAFGDRLFHAVEDLLSAGYSSVCLINSDSPTLPTALLRSAITAVARAGDRVVLGAANDGGYYLVGLKQAHRKLFENIDWSTSKVLAQTIERATELELETEILPAWYDVDDAATLRQLCVELLSRNGGQATQSDMVAYGAPYTRSYLSRLINSDGVRQRIWDSADKPA